LRKQETLTLSVIDENRQIELFTKAMYQNQKITIKAVYDTTFFFCYSIPQKTLELHDV
jgi:hypothetical protein